MLSTVRISYGLYKLLIDSDWIDFKWIIFIPYFKTKKKFQKTMHHALFCK